MDAAPGHCFDKRTDENIEMFLDGNILHPLSIWIPMHEDIGLNVFLSSHSAALACLRCHREHYQRVRMQWNQTHPKGTDDQFYPHWVAFVVRHLEKAFTAEQRIRGKRLVVQKYQPVVFHALAIHSGTCCPGHRLFGLCATQVCFLVK